MPRGDKSAYSEKQKRQAEHIEDSYEKRGLGKQEAERRAWATVNRESGGGVKKKTAGKKKAAAKKKAASPAAPRKRAGKRATAKN